MLILRSPRAIIFLVAAAVIALACDLRTFLPGTTRPTVVIQNPVAGATFREGQEVAVQSMSSDPTGVIRVELIVDGQVVASDTPPIPQGQTSFALVQRWKATAGTHTLGVRAYNVAGAGSDPAIVSVTVEPARVAQMSPTAPAPTPTELLLPTLTPTRRPVTPTRVLAVSTPTVPSIAPGVYAIALRLEPANPRVNQFVTFHVTFLNTTNATKRYRWFVKIYRPDERHSFGETAKADIDIPAGRSEFATPANWRVGGYNDCQPFFARPFSFDNVNNEATEFLKSDGQAVNQGFSVCP